MRWIKGKWLLRAVAFIVVVIVGYLVAFRIATHRKEEPRPVQVDVDGQTVKIVVAPNVHVSVARAAKSHRETVVAADPTCARRVVAFAIADRSVIGYTSADGGKTWQVGMEPQPRTGYFLCDPALIFGVDGTLHFVCQESNVVEDEGTAVKTKCHFSLSPDGGMTWEALGTVQHNSTERPMDSEQPCQRYMDRPWLAVDQTRGKNRGRLYCCSFQWLDVSADQGRTFSSLPQPVRKGYQSYNPANPLVLSDGRLVLAYRFATQRLNNLPGLGILVSDDGGQTLSEAAWVGADRYDPRVKVQPHGFLPQMCADAFTVQYRDRLYAVWEDGNGPNGVRILYACSKDKGHTWVGPMVLSEQPDDGDIGYSAEMPAIAVNKDGTVAVTWYDRRGLPNVAGRLHPSGCNVRFRASLDGGETWQPSVQVNERTIKSSIWELRDTQGLAADADGAFHSVWVDDRTGTLQVWTAKVELARK